MGKNTGRVGEKQNALKTGSLHITAEHDKMAQKGPSSCPL